LKRREVMRLRRAKPANSSRAGGANCREIFERAARFRRPGAAAAAVRERPISTLPRREEAPEMRA